MLTPPGSSPPIRREIRFDLSATRHRRLTHPHGPGRRRAGRFVQPRSERHRSFCSEGPKGRNRKERCSGRHGPGRRRACRFVQLRKERIRSVRTGAGPCPAPLRIACLHSFYFILTSLPSISPIRGRAAYFGRPASGSGENIHVRLRTGKLFDF